jgi:subtilisin family serine protease
VLDSGIQADHPAFADDRVLATLDFTRVRDIISTETIKGARHDELLQGITLEAAEAKQHLRQLEESANEGAPLNWDLVEELITLDRAFASKQLTSHHGTHVAGIIGAAETNGRACGMCPDIGLYDFRVLGNTMEETEFAVIAALQYIRYLNDRYSYTTIHGANLSLSIPHNVRNYACGSTPICKECERLVESGVVVVAAAGNRGYQYFETTEGVFEGYAAFSITDPGNADGVITVGATHANWPHTYGVSFFSSRGPTGDGRAKPDLVAPGERIEAPIPESDWAQQSGTSMAAPHVSGAAAMLLARYTELVGQPRRIKEILCETATDLGRERSFQGHGMLDVLRALQSI